MGQVLSQATKLPAQSPGVSLGLGLLLLGCGTRSPPALSRDTAAMAGLSDQVALTPRPSRWKGRPSSLAGCPPSLCCRARVQAAP